MDVPELEKIVVNMGIGDAARDARTLEGAMHDLAVITGQRPSPRPARKSVAGFRVRAGQPVGAKVTLRRDQMWDFFDRLMSVALPRVRDFRGLSPKSFDGNGNYTFGIGEQLIFPEIDYDSIDAVRGMDVTITTTARTDESGRALLEEFGFPFADVTPTRA
jgi:large subunit ribosomal protein L5